MPVFYTFGNHMHWVDMQWLWGYDVLPGCVRDMLRLIGETNARGNVNFDAIGYEKMAAECPEALADLREAVAKGYVEPVGCSYGQPYGLFHGAESNIRQLTHGVRATRRLLGVRPRAFWEEEFYFFPQLPQLLSQCGYTGACLFFQWTWHTPEMPHESSPLILWEGADGTRLPALPRGDLNVHQWPEDFEGLLDRVATGEQGGGRLTPAIVQWLELMPSRDWMCRSEVLLPGVRALMGDARFEVTPATLSEIIANLRESAGVAGSRADVPVRAYSMDDVWHGMTLGKNADRHPRTSRTVERNILLAESVSAVAGLLGRPYPSWDVYPTWELDEAWRECLAAQHHDNHECEGLCGDIAYTQFDKAKAMAFNVVNRTFDAKRVRTGEGDEMAVFNALGWARTVTVVNGNGDSARVTVPPFGWVMAEPESDDEDSVGDVEITREDGVIELRRGRLAVKVDARRGTILQIESTALGKWSLDASRPLLDLSMRVNGKVERFSSARFLDLSRFSEHVDTESLFIRREGGKGGSLTTIIRLSEDCEAVEVDIVPDMLVSPDPGLAGALRLPITPAFRIGGIVTDSPCAVHEVAGRGCGRRKYPTGDWMTSPQWFEDISDAFTSYSLVDLLDGGKDDGRGLLIAHDGSQQWFRTERGVEMIAHASDPWDGAGKLSDADARIRLRIMPHGPMTHAQRVRESHEHHIQAEVLDAMARDVSLSGLGGLEVCSAPGVLAHAYFRESMKSGEHLPDWAGHRMFAESSGACDHPYVIRLIEWNGQPAEVTLKLPGPVAMAAKTNLLGEVPSTQRKQVSPSASSSASATFSSVASSADVGGWSWRDTAWLEVEHPVSPPDWASEMRLGGNTVMWSAVRFRMRPREIATIYADLVLGRKQWRDLDAKREVWATVHRT